MLSPKSELHFWGPAGHTPLGECDPLRAVCSETEEVGETNVDPAIFFATLRQALLGNFQRKSNRAG